MELDLRSIPPAGGHAQAYRAFRDLGVGEPLMLIADRDLAELRGQFERDFPRSFSWRDLESGPALWRVELLKTARTALPQIVGNTRALAAAATDATAVRAQCKASDRELCNDVAW